MSASDLAGRDTPLMVASVLSGSRLDQGALAILALAVPGLFACSDVSVDIEPVVRDSAGVRIVENIAPTRTDHLHGCVASDPETTIGMANVGPGHELYRVIAASRLEDGRIVVANAGTFELRYFAPDGVYLGPAGGQGSGPGEFERMSDVYAGVSDSILVFDNRMDRVSVFNGDGIYARSYTVRVPGVSLLDPVGVFSDGSLLLTGNGLSSDQLGVRPDSLTYYRVDASGGLLGTVGRFFRGDWVSVPEGSGTWSQRVPFGRVGSVAVADDMFVFGSSETYQFETYSIGGQLERIARLPHETSSLRRESLDSARSAELSLASNDMIRGRIAAIYDAAATVRTRPAWSVLTTDRDGHFWASEYGRADDEPQRWSVFASDGVFVGAVDTPAGLDIHEIGADYIIGERRDEFGVETVEVYPLLESGC